MRSNPFEVHEAFCEIRECEECNERVLVYDHPVFFDDPRPTSLRLPTLDGLGRAMEIVGDARAKGEGLDEKEALIAMLLDAFAIHRELLSRAVTYGIDGSGSPELDDEMLEETLRVAHDLFRIGLRRENAHPDEPVGIDLDLGHLFCEFGDEFTASLDCTDPDCELHNDKPVPTDFEA